MYVRTLYGEIINVEIVENNLTRIGNQIFKLLPWREEKQDWIKPLETLIIELSGMAHLFPNQEAIFSLICKLNGLNVQKDECDFYLFRRTIFECCSMITNIKTEIKKLEEVTDVPKDTK